MIDFTSVEGLTPASRFFAPEAGCLHCACGQRRTLPLRPFVRLSVELLRQTIGGSDAEVPDIGCALISRIAG